jgi:hypothetical protein
MNKERFMKRWSLLMLAVFAGCARSPLPTIATSASAFPATFTHHQTFRYVGKKQNFKVPAGVTQIKVVAIGGEGGGKPVGHPGRVSAILPVTSGERLAIYVGGNGTFKAGGFNGGGKPGNDGFGGANGYGGGGASDLRAGGDALKDRILVSGGGGGQGGFDGSGEYAPYGVGGKGGGLVGGAGGSGYPRSYYSTCGVDEAGCGGGGGSQTAGGSGGKGGEFICYGNNGSAGTLGVGGAGAMVGTTSSGHSYECAGLGGGGGGGYYGGGGGGGGGGYNYYDGGGGGGGGGSSYVEPSALNAHLLQGFKQVPYGLIVISW